MSLKGLFEAFSLSPWCDDLSRDEIDGGQLTELVDKGVRGVTSNPTIFARAVSSSDAYTKEIRRMTAAGRRPEAIYWELAIKDARDAADVLRPLYTSTDGTDGYVSLEVSPKFAHDHVKTIAQARLLWSSVRRANLMIKIPATPDGLIAISKLTAEGVNINVTLVFSLRRYLEVMNAYLVGLEKRDGSLRQVHSVASFFVSRIDTVVDHLLEKNGSASAKSLLGKAAIAQAHAAYGLFLEMFNPVAHRWQELESRGANIQRPLWASTSVKNPNYDPLMYVNSLLLPCSVNTMPLDTLKLAHKKSVDGWNLPKETFALDAHRVIADIESHGISFNRVTMALEIDGIKKFTQSYDGIIRAIGSRT
ncbi:MAG: transaldolase [Patescibacteria group bacterium]